MQRCDMSFIQNKLEMFFKYLERRSAERFCRDTIPYIFPKHIGDKWLSDIKNKRMCAVFVQDEIIKLILKMKNEEV
jgi:hypothetical protein